MPDPFLTPANHIRHVLKIFENYRSGLAERTTAV